MSKIVFGLIAPSHVCLAMTAGGLLAGQWQRWRRFGLRLAVSGFVLLLILGFSPVGLWITWPLENRFATAAPPPPKAVQHIVVLGGFEEARTSRAHAQLTVNGAAERLMAIPALMRRYPAAKVVFSGGEATLFADPVNGVAWVKRFLTDAGVPPERIVLEGKSRTTWENALFVRNLLRSQGDLCPCGTLLVTSAWHMPRSVGVFRKLGFDTRPARLFAWPVDYQTLGGGEDWQMERWLHRGLRKTDSAAKEWLGLLGYWMAGRTSGLWPGPAEKSH